MNNAKYDLQRNNIWTLKQQKYPKTSQIMRKNGAPIW